MLFSVGTLLWGDLLHGYTIDQDEDQSDDVHENERSNHGILGIKVRLAPLCHSNQHPTDAKLNRNDGSTVADFKDEEELVHSSVLCRPT